MNSLQRRFLPLTFAALVFLSILQISANDVPMNPSDVSALLDALEKRLSSIKTLSAGFDQTKRLALFDDALAAKGAIYFSNPGKIRFEILAPFQSVLLVVDQDLAKFERGQEGWKRLELKNADGLALVMQQIGDWMKGDFRSQSKIFAITGATRGENQILILTSKPKQFAKYIERIEIVVAPDRSRFESIAIFEPGGDSTVLAFTSDVRDKDLPLGTFDLKLAKPIDMGSGDP